MIEVGKQVRFTAGWGEKLVGVVMSHGKRNYMGALVMTPYVCVRVYKLPYTGEFFLNPDEIEELSG